MLRKYVKPATDAGIAARIADTGGIFTGGKNIFVSFADGINPVTRICRAGEKKGRVFVYEALEHRIARMRDRDPATRMYRTNIAERLQVPCERLVKTIRDQP